VLGPALAVIAVCICACLVYVVLRIEVRHASHYLLIASAAALGLWNACAYCVYNARTEEDLLRMFLISTVGMFLFVVANNGFAFFVSRAGSGVGGQGGPEPASGTKTGARRDPWWYLVAVSVPALVFASLLFRDSTTFISFERLGSGWRFRPNLDSPANFLWLVYAFLLMASCQVYLALRLRRTKLKRQRRQLRLLIVSGLIAWIPAFFQLMMHDAIAGMPNEFYTPVFLLPWAIGNTVAVHHYQFLGVSPEEQFRDILRSTRELVILAGDDGTVAFINDAARRFFGRPGWELMSESVEVLLCGPDCTDALLPACPEELIGIPVGRRIAVPAGDNDRSPRTVDLEITAVTDRFQDFVGYLLVGSVIEPPQSLMVQFGLTRRECEIVQCILNGWSYSAIAEFCHITESTIKTHVTHIFRKMHVRNRMDLLRIIEHRDAVEENTRDRPLGRRGQLAGR
jgi:DNA-binding CsgD family transcriptional regulator